MSGIITLLMANIKRRKTQSILTAIIIVFAAIMFTTSLCITTSIGEPFKKMYENLNASQIQFVNGNNLYDTGKIADWWEKEGVKVQTFKFHYSVDRLVIKGKEISDGYVFFTEKPNSILKQDKLAIAEGKAVNCPEPGEVWISISFADKYKLKINDSISASTKDGLKRLRISAIVSDPQFGSPAMGVLRVWISPGSLKEMFNEIGNGDFIGLRFNDYSERDSLWSEFENYLGMPYTGNMFDYEIISSAYVMQYKIMGAILMIFSFILLLIAVFIISFTISTAVAADVKTIGILKAQGYTPFSITLVYALQYVALSVISVPIGVISSFYIVRLITNMVTRSMGMTSMNISLILPGVAAFLVIVTVVAAVSLFVAGKAGSLKPVRAIREELIEIKGLKHISFKRIISIPLTLFLAIKNIFTQKGQSLLLLFCFIALGSVLTFSVNLMNTFSDTNLLNKSDKWGFDKRADTFVFKENVDSKLQNEIIEVIKKSNRVKAAIPVLDWGFPARVEAQNGKTNKNIQASVFDGEISDLKAGILEGRNPESDTEVAASILVCRQYRKNIGDYITVSIGGKKVDLLITGIYQSANYMGWNLRFQASTILRAIPDFKLRSTAVIYNDPNYRDAFIKSLKDKYGDKIDIQPYKDAINGFMYSVKSGIYSFVIMLTGIFVIVLIIIIFNSSLVNIYREKRIFGTYKAFGMTPLQVRSAIVWRILVLSSVGSIIGILISYIGAGKMMSLMLTGMGLSEYPEVVTIPGMLLVIPVCLLLSFIASWVPSGRIHNISPRTLIMD